MREYIEDGRLYVTGASGQVKPIEVPRHPLAGQLSGVMAGVSDVRSKSEQPDPGRDLQHLDTL